MVRMRHHLDGRRTPAHRRRPLALARHHRRVDRRARGRRRARRGHLLGVEEIYRDKLRRQGVVFVYMQGTFDEVMERLSHRQGHFMKPSMLQSQSDILEEPGDDEIHVNVHIGQADPEHEAMAVAGALGL